VPEAERGKAKGIELVVPVFVGHLVHACIIPYWLEVVKRLLEILLHLSTNIPAVKGLRLARLHAPQVTALTSESADAVASAESAVCVRVVHRLHAPIIPYYRQKARSN
jgi:hypothetical protein